MDSILKAKILTKNDEELLLNYISNLFDISKKYLLVPLKSEDLLLKCSRNQEGIQITVINNSFDHIRDTETTSSKLEELTKYFFNNMETGKLIQNYNEYTKKTICNSFEIYFDSRLAPQINKGSVFNGSFLYLMTQTGDIIDFMQEQFQGNYSVYIFCHYDNLSKKFIEYLKNIKENIPSKIKNVFLVIAKEKYNHETFYQEEFTKLFENSSENLEIISFFTFLLLDIGSNRVNPYYTNLNEEQFTFYIVDPENRIIKIQDINFEVISIFKEDLEKATDEGYQKTKKQELMKSCEILSTCIQKKKEFRKLPYLFKYSLSYSLYLKISKDFLSLIPVKISSIKVEGELKLKEYQMLNSLIESTKSSKISSTIKLHEEFNINLKQFPTLKCSNRRCRKIIPDTEGLYYCHWCKIFFCEKCVEKAFTSSPTNKRDRAIHKEHNLLYFTSRDENDLSHLDQYKIGTNVFATASDSELRISHNAASCNGCHGSFDSVPRYVCISCRPGLRIFGGFCDFCYNCFLHLKKNDEQGKRMEGEEDSFSYYDEPMENEKYIPKLHSHKHHVYLCLIFQVGYSYDNY